MRKDGPMAKRILSDTARANWSLLIALAPAMVIILLMQYQLSVSHTDGGWRRIVLGFVVVWPLFAGTYLVWTHLAYRPADAAELRVATRQEQEARTRWWHKFVGYGGALDWTIAGAVVAVAMTVAIAQDPAYRGNGLFVLLALATVASSWALMVYSFALEYLRLNSGSAPNEATHIVFPFQEPPRFGDYLTLAVLLSTMAATVSAQVKSRRGWRVVRTNVILAFTFNSVIVALMVSALLSGLAGQS